MCLFSFRASAGGPCRAGHFFFFRVRFFFFFAAPALMRFARSLTSPSREEASRRCGFPSRLRLAASSSAFFRRRRCSRRMSRIPSVSLNSFDVGSTPKRWSPSRSGAKRSSCRSRPKSPPETSPTRSFRSFSFLLRAPVSFLPFILSLRWISRMS